MADSVHKNSLMPFCRPLWIRPMTVFPQTPNLVDSQPEGFKKLVEPHLTFVKMGCGFSLAVLIREGLETDGATIPKEELEKSNIIKKICKIIAKHYPGKDYKETLDYLMGTPFEMPRLLAAIVHDALYGMKWKWRWLCDMVYRSILSETDYDKLRLGIEYYGTRLLGKKSWDAVTDLERDRTRRIVDVRVVLTRNIRKIMQRLEKELVGKP